MNILESIPVAPGQNLPRSVPVRVLVIDDEPTIRGALSELLRAEGYEVVAATSGREAVEYLRFQRFELAITDLLMPEMDGVQTMAALKEIDPDIAVMVLTGHSAAESAIAALRKGACDYLLKPIDLAKLRPAVRRALDMQRLNPTLSLVEATRKIMQGLGGQKLIPAALEFSRSAVRATAAGIARATGENPGLHLHLSGGGPLLEGTVKSLARRAIEVREAFVAPPFEGGRWEGNGGPIPDGSALAYPLEARDTILGALVLWRDNGVAPFSAIDLRRGKILAAEIAGAMDKSAMSLALSQTAEELRAAHAVAARAEATARAIIDSAREAIVLFDEGGVVRDFNPMASEMFGWRREKDIGRNLPDFAISPSMRGVFKRHLEAALRFGRDPQSGCMVVYALRGNGEEFPIEVSTALIETPQGNLLSTFARDISDRKRAEEALRESQTWLRTIFDTVQAGILVIDPNTHTIVDANPAALELAQRTRDLTVGVECHKFICPAEKGHCPVTDLGKKVYCSESWLLTIESKKRTILKTVVPQVIAGRELLVESFIDITDRKRAEQQTRVQTAALESAANGVVITDREGSIVWANPAFTRLSGYTVAEAIGQNPRILKSGAHDAGFYKNLWDTILAGQVWKGSFINRRRDGSHYSEEATITPVRDTDGSITHFIAVKEDVTERKRSEQQLRESEERYRLLFENNLAGVIRTRMDGRIVECNQALANMLGFNSPQDVCTLRMQEIYFSEEDRIQALERVKEEGRLTNQEVRFRRKDGSPIWLIANVGPAPESKDGPQIIEGTLVDISERKQAEESLRRERGLLRALMDNIPDFIYFKDRASRIVRTNLAHAMALGLSDPRQAEGKTDLDFFPLEDAQNYFADDQQVIHSGEPLTRRLERVHLANGEDRWASTIKVPIRDGQGAITGLVGITRDVTEQIQAEEMRKAKEAAEAASRVKSQFLASMSHELRTPLNGVIGMTNLLLGTELSAEQRRYAQVASTCGETLLTVINNILDFSKIEARKLILESIDFDLREVVEGTIEMLAVPADKKGLELTCLVAPETPSLVKGDPGRLRQVLLNLVGNAIKFTHRGDVAIRVQLDHEEKNTVVIRFAVEDTGVGIPEERLKDLFSPFIQADGSTTRKYGGTGLGLAISKDLAELMGGRIGVESKQGKGSTFWFTVVLQKQEDHGGQSADLGDEFQGVKILIADDNAANRLVMSTLLKSWGCRTSQACDGASTLEILQKASPVADPFKVAFLDNDMLGLNGVDLAKRIAADSQLDRTALVLMTGPNQSLDDGVLTGIRLAGHIPKPVIESRLRTALGVALGNKQRLEKPPGEPVAALPSSIPSNADARMLVVEDIASNREVVLAILGKLGYRAETVNNGAEALAALGSNRYDLILMDCAMPEMDGYEATRHIRRQEIAAAKPRIPVIALTASVISGDRDKCIEAGMDDFLGKPINPRELAEALAKWLHAAPQASAPEIRETNAPQPLSSVFDEKELLGRLMGDRAVAGKIVAGFSLDAPVQMRLLWERLEAGNAGEVRRLAHGLKGAASTVAAGDLRAIALEIEVAASAGDLGRATKLYPSLVQKLERLKAVLHDSGWI